LGYKEAGDAVLDAIERVIKESPVKTRDMGGQASTEEMGKEIANALS
jgi:tartrate dehydrogenase/decarboxylase/D-malate dehydrogenase